MQALENPIQNYAWGSKTTLAALLGRPPSPEPEAELWIGAHPKAPSRLASGPTLDRAIGAEPDAWLGVACRRRFGERLPYLLKVLAVEQPLSLQAHPTRAQAETGFAREERAGLARDAFERTYKDDNHKPELLCALTPFEALCGFRAPERSAALLEQLGLSDPSWAAELGSGHPDALRRVFSRLMGLEPSPRRALLAQVVRGAERAVQQASGPDRAALAWTARLAQAYPGDIGAVGALLLNHVTLRPLEAIYLPAGQLHAYLSGTGVEIMANSDNVLRGGLTPKHVNVAELLRVLSFQAHEAAPVSTRGDGSSELCVYHTPAPEFALGRLQVGPRPIRVETHGPRLWLCTQGEVRVQANGATLTLRPGHACALRADEPGCTLDGAGQVFHAGVNSDP